MIFENVMAFRNAGFRPKVCIIGSGPAGITIARKLGSAGIPVVILEAGGGDWSEESQDFYRGKTIGDPYFDLDITRLRYLGGFQITGPAGAASWTLMISRQSPGLRIPAGR